MDNYSVTFSDLLKHLLDRLKQKEGTDNASPTIEEFLVSALDVCCFQKDSALKDKMKEEIADTKHVFEDHFSDTKKLKASLKRRNPSDPGKRRTSSILLINLLETVRAEAAKKGSDSLCADKAVEYILLFPPDALKDLLVRKDSSDLLPTLTAEARDLRKKLSEKVFGQDHAIQTVVEGYFKAEASYRTEENHNRPKAVFLFAGPPGVGKTLLAESLKDALGLPYQRYDMSEHASLTAYGAATDFFSNIKKYLKNNKNSILLFDEIEKASDQLILLFLQILDGGRVAAEGDAEDTPFKDTILIFTTNAGRPLYEDSDTGNFSDIPQKTVIKALEQDKDPKSKQPYFPQELCSRLTAGNVVMFNRMETPFLVRIAKEEIRRRAEGYQKAFGISIVVDSPVYSTILFSEGGMADARTVKSRSETFLQNEIYELARLADGKGSSLSSGRIRKIKITTKLPEMSEAEEEGQKKSDADEIRRLFYSENPQNLLVFATKKTVNSVRETCSNIPATYEVIGEQYCQKAEDILLTKDIRLILVDPTCRTRGKKPKYLNLEDIDSEARDLLSFIREKYRDIPVYLLKPERRSINEEEMVSFLRAGVSGLVDPAAPDFCETLKRFSEQLHQEDSMRELARSNQIVTFETAQKLSSDGSEAEILLFDLALKTAIEPGDSKNILGDMSRPNVHFDDICGAKAAKEALTYFMNGLSNPRLYNQLGASPPGGVLLYGPPGTGKTMLAQALANEAKAAFIAIAGSSFLQKWLGDGPRKVQEYFAMARKYAPCVLFVDEVDAIATDRNAEANTPGRVDVLDAFLAEMSGFHSDYSKPVFVLAATNLRDRLDEAFRRRFDEQIYVGNPELAERKEFLEKRTKKNKAFNEITPSMIDSIAKRSAGMSPANLEHVLERAIRLAIQNNLDHVTDELLDESYERQRYGEEKEQPDEEELKRVARHEAGHAFMYLEAGEVPAYITIVSRGSHGGYVQREEERGLRTKRGYLALIRACLAGRAAEMVYYNNEEDPEGGISSGAFSDLENATFWVEQMVCRLGMDPEVGLASYVDSKAQMESPSPEARKQIKEILEEQMNLAVQIIQENQGKINRIVDVLLDRYQITGEELQKLLGGDDPEEAYS